MKNFLLLMSLLFSMNVLAMGGKPAKKPVQKPTIEDEFQYSGVPETTRSNKTSLIHVASFKGFSKKGIQEFWKVTGKVNETISSACYKDFMLGRKMVQTNGKTNEEILKETLENTVKIHFVSYYRNNGTVGYTYPNQSPDKYTVWMNRKFHSRMSLCKRAGNVMHETRHKMGYGHDFKRTKRRPYSVPYSDNAAFNACCK